MNKVILIIKREYLSRITKKTFILSTILTPLFFIGITVFSVYMTKNNTEQLKIAVYDESGLFAHKLTSDENIAYSIVAKPIFDSFVAHKPVEDYSGVLHIPTIDITNPASAEYISTQQLGVFSDSKVEDDLNDVLQQQRMIAANIDTAKLNAIKRNPIAIGQKVISESGDKDESRTANSGMSYMVGYASGFLIYMLMFIYGSMVMRGIMEEKISRIAEVMVSSVKPIQLMMGKIIGIGAVGLTQFIIWIVLIVIGYTAVGAYLAPSAQDLHNISQQASSQQGTQAVMNGLAEMKGQFNIPLLIGMFIFYFITGYLFYASLFAAVGSAVNEDPQDAQSMMFPITIPIIISIILMSSAVANPTGAVAVWASIIPFTSPVIMMARLPFGVPGTVPYWQLGLSIIVMIIGFVSTTWFCARVYRVGILMYGKKPSWKEMLKWVFVK